MNLIKCADIPDHFEKIYKEEYQFYLKSKDDKKGAVLNGTGKDIVRMEPPVGNEYRDSPGAGNVPVDQLIECGKLIPFAHGHYDCVGIGLIQQVIQRNEVHLVIAFLGAPTGGVIAFGILRIPCKGKARPVTCQELVPAF